MDISGNVLLTLGGTLAKWLAKRFLGDKGPDIAGDLIDLTKDRIADVMERRNAARQFDGYADQIIQKLRESLGNRGRRHPELDGDAVFGELSKTLATGVTDHFLVARDLDPVVIDADLQRRRPLPGGALPDLETRVYREVLQEVVRYLIEVASVLPKFEASVAKQSLRRLSNLGRDVEQVLQTVQRLEARVVEPGARADARFDADYRAALIRGLDRVDLFGADIPPENQRNLLTEAFVTLNLDRAWTSDERAPDDGSESDDALSEASLITCEELFNSLEPDASRSCFSPGHSLDTFPEDDFNQNVLFLLRPIPESETEITCGHVRTHDLRARCAISGPAYALGLCHRGHHSGRAAS